MGQTQKNVSPMSNEGRNTYVVEQLTTTLLELLKEKNLEDISISELVSKAGVGRASFYRNFQSKEDIIKKSISTKMSEWTFQWEQNKTAPLSEQLKMMFNHFAKYHDFYQLINDCHLIYLLKDVIIGIYGPKPEYEKRHAYASAFVAYSLYGWIEVWFQRGMQETPEEIAAMFKEQGL